MTVRLKVLSSKDCGPCRQFKKALDKLKKEHGDKFEFDVLDIEDEDEDEEWYDIFEEIGGYDFGVPYAALITEKEEVIENGLGWDVLETAKKNLLSSV